MDDGPLEALSMMGASEAQLAELRQWIKARSAQFALWPDNEETLRLAQAMATQWRVGMGGYVGLDYNVLPWMMELLDIDKTAQADTFAGLRIVEAEVLALMSDKA